MAITLADRPVMARKESLYTDFKTNFDIHPGSNDLQSVGDAEAVKRSIVNLLKTTRYERPFQPSVGSTINMLLFDNMDSHTLMFMKQLIEDTITTHERRAILNSIAVSPSPDDNSVGITIVFSLINSSTPITLDVVLNKVR